MLIPASTVVCLTGMPPVDSLFVALRFSNSWTPLRPLTWPRSLHLPPMIALLRAGVPPDTRVHPDHSRHWMGVGRLMLNTDVGGRTVSLFLCLPRTSYHRGTSALASCSGKNLLNQPFKYCCLFSIGERN